MSLENTTRRVVAMDVCDYCEGRGHDDNPLWHHRCPECEGKGLVPIEAVSEPAEPEDGDYHQYIWSEHVHE